MESDLSIRLVQVDPPPGVDFGIQRGGGAQYETLFVQQAKQGDVIFDFSLTVTDNRKDSLPNFKGPFAQGPPASRFIYIDVGTCAGQTNTQWSRRMKVPLQGDDDYRKNIRRHQPEEQPGDCRPHKDLLTKPLRCDRFFHATPSRCGLGLSQRRSAYSKARKYAAAGSIMTAR